MKNRSTPTRLRRLSVWLLLLLITIRAGAQIRCDSLIVPLRAGQETPQAAWSLQLHPAGGGALFHYGAEHVSDPAHRQFGEIRTHWQATQPTLALYEGPDRGIAATDTSTIRTVGESGYVRFLANQAGIRAMSLEPQPRDQYQFLLTQFPQERVDLYFLLGEAMRLRTRKGYTKEQISAELERQFGILRKVLGTPPAIGTIAALEAAYRLYWNDGTNWWEAPANWFNPAKSSTGTGGIFTNEINQSLSHYRDVHMVKLLSEQVAKGERVFAVVGRNHVPRQIPALRCAITEK